ncbi:MAG: dehydrogenase [Rhizobacter sp.]|nr:dehydrogenase [Rhizobacter sp.]
MADTASDVLVLVTHPNLEASVVNRRLMKAAHRAEVEVRDLYALYPDYLIDVEAEQAALARAKLVVLQHPLQWYSMPPLMKLWLDDVLSFGWAYGPGGTALNGKNLWLVTSTGGPQESYHPQSYNRYFFDAFLPPYEQTAALCGMRFLPPLVLHGATQVGHDTLESHVQTYFDQLVSYPHWPELDEAPDCIACEVPMTARPPADDDAAPTLLVPPSAVAASARPASASKTPTTA